MNKQRRTEINKISAEIESIKARLKKVLSDEEFAFDNIPENLQGSTRYEESEEAIDCMNEAIDNLDEAIDQLSDV